VAKKHIIGVGIGKGTNPRQPSVPPRNELTRNIFWGGGRQNERNQFTKPVQTTLEGGCGTILLKSNREEKRRGKEMVFLQKGRGGKVFLRFKKKSRCCGTGKQLGELGKKGAEEKKWCSPPNSQEFTNTTPKGFGQPRGGRHPPGGGGGEEM